MGRGGDGAASPSSCPVTPEGLCQVATPCQAGEGLPSSLEQGRHFYRRKQFSERVGREVGASSPLPCLLMCFQFGNQKSVHPSRSPTTQGMGFSGSGGPGVAPLASFFKAAPHCQRSPTSRERVGTQSPQTACRERAQFPVLPSPHPEVLPCLVLSHPSQGPVFKFGGNRDKPKGNLGNVPQLSLTCQCPPPQPAHTQAPCAPSHPQLPPVTQSVA